MAADGWGGGEPGLGGWERLLFQLQALSGEYLFFIGATYIAVLLLRHRRWLTATATFGLAVLWLSFHLPVSLYLESLGVDSFAETRGFDLDEARFWAQTLQESIQPDFSLKKFGAYLAVALLSFYSLRWLLQRRGLGGRRYVAAKLSLALGLIGLAFFQTTSTALAFYLENTEKFHATAHNYVQAPPALHTGAPMDLVVYIGESTSTMNMSLYGYPRPTTPELDALAARDPGLVVFDHVFATHAHTSRSLLEALSFGVDPSQAYLPITDRKRVSVVDVLRQGGFEPRLLSNQGQGGSWDQASSVIFKNARKVFRARSTPGQAEQDRPWDPEFFEDELARLPAPPGPGQVVFLHSYAGHGPYHKNIPQAFRQAVDGQLSALSEAEVVRTPGVPIALIEEYDAAVRYVDHSVTRTLARFEQSARPTVFVYFSDHGDAVYAGLGHDSARFRHEMARVPFLIHFNEAARQARPGLLQKYQALARANHTATLAQLPSTLLDLLGARLDPHGAGQVLQTPLIGQATALPPIMVRQTAGGMTFVNLNGTPGPVTAPSGHPVNDRTDDETRLYVAMRSQAASPLEARRACQRPASTFEELSRRIMLLGCKPASPHTAPGAPAS